MPRGMVARPGIVPGLAVAQGEADSFQQLHRITIGATASTALQTLVQQESCSHAGRHLDSNLEHAALASLQDT